MISVRYGRFFFPLISLFRAPPKNCPKTLVRFSETTSAKRLTSISTTHCHELPPCHCTSVPEIYLISHNLSKKTQTINHAIYHCSRNRCLFLLTGGFVPSPVSFLSFAYKQLEDDQSRSKVFGKYCQIAKYGCSIESRFVNIHPFLFMNPLT